MKTRAIRQKPKKHRARRTESTSTAGTKPPCFAVYHAQDQMAMVMPNANLWHIDREQHFRQVADVQAPLEAVFALTNHGAVSDASWTSNHQVVWHADIPLRSSCVGDVFVCCATGRAWLVKPVGLGEIVPQQGESR